MRLSLSSAALADASFEELVTAAARRGLAGLELRARDAHGVAPAGSSLDLAAAVALAAAAGVAVTGFRTDAADDAEGLAWLAHSLHAAILVDDAGDVESRICNALPLRDAGIATAVVIGGADAVRDAADIAAVGLDIAWDADAAAAPVAQQAEALLSDCRDALRHVLLVGGGPEVAMREGMGVGALMGALALGGFDGNVVLAPSSTRYRVAWQTWLGRRGGWGCGSKAESAPLPLAGGTPVAGG